LLLGCCLYEQLAKPIERDPLSLLRQYLQQERPEKLACRLADSDRFPRPLNRSDPHLNVRFAPILLKNFQVL